MSEKSCNEISMISRGDVLRHDISKVFDDGVDYRRQWRAVAAHGCGRFCGEKLSLGDDDFERGRNALSLAGSSGATRYLKAMRGGDRVTSPARVERHETAQSVALCQ